MHARDFGIEDTDALWQSGERVRGVRGPCQKPDDCEYGQAEPLNRMLKCVLGIFVKAKVRANCYIPKGNIQICTNRWLSKISRTRTRTLCQSRSRFLLQLEWSIVCVLKGPCLHYLALSTVCHHILRVPLA